MLLVMYVVCAGSIIGFSILYHNMRGLPRRSQLELAVCMTLLFVMSILFIGHANMTQKLLRNKDFFADDVKEFDGSSIGRISVEPIPVDKYQLQFTSALGDTTFSIITTKAEVMRLKKLLEQ